MINDLKKFGDVEENASFKKITSIRIGGEIKYLCSPKTIDDFKNLMDYLIANNIPHKVVGKGSNIVACDSFFDGVVVRLNKMQSFVFEDNYVVADAGCSAIKLANEAMKRSKSNLEFISGIPGTMGGLVYMNAGAYKQEIKDILLEVLVYQNGEIKWINKDQLHFSYRHSSFMEEKDTLVLACKLALVDKDSEQIKALMDDRLKRRNTTQPIELPSCGSCFKNPENQFVWQLIDGIGMRGFQRNGLEVSQKHPNFIVNKGGAKFEDFIFITNKIKQDVKDKYGIDLFLEAELFEW